MPRGAGLPLGGNSRRVLLGVVLLCISSLRSLEFPRAEEGLRDGDSREVHLGLVFIRALVFLHGLRFQRGRESLLDVASLLGL